MAAVTLTDVVSHPAYEKYMVNVSAKVIERMRKILQIHDEYEQIKDRMIRYGLTVRTPSTETDSGNHHFKECVWSNPTAEEGPDTCICFSISYSCYNIIQLLNALLEKEDEF